MARAASGWKRPPGTSYNHPKRGRFSGDAIDISRFIKKAETLKPVEVFVPRYTFNDLEIRHELKQTIKNRGYVTPTPIQDMAIPAVLSGRDVIGLANTGTGKTAAFLIPLTHKILVNPTEKVLIVVPTRELAIQIQDEFIALARALRLYSVVVVGGANIGRQISELRLRHNMVIGTPGRLKDLITRKVLNLSGFNNIVLDEADRMFDMGFLPDVKLFLSLVSKKRQTMLFSATLSREIENLTRQFLNNPERISIKTGETSALVDQDVVRVTMGKDKSEVLHDLLNQVEFQKVLIFTRTKHGADKLSKKLHLKGFKSECIHGNKSQAKGNARLRCSRITLLRSWWRLMWRREVLIFRTLAMSLILIFRRPMTIISTASAALAARSKKESH